VGILLPAAHVIAVGLILAWKVAGYFGADYYLLRYIGTPWHGRRDAEPETAAASTKPVRG